MVFSRNLYPETDTLQGLVFPQIFFYELNNLIYVYQTTQNVRLLVKSKLGHISQCERVP